MNTTHGYRVRAQQPATPGTALGAGADRAATAPALKEGGGAVFEEAVRQACRAFVEARPDLQPLIVPLRSTVLVVPPVARNGREKDLDNILITVLSILEAELKPHATPWALAPRVSLDGEPTEPHGPPAVSGSQTWACQRL